jgi:hypothetical protein
VPPREYISICKIFLNIFNVIIAVGCNTEVLNIFKIKINVVNITN